MSSKFAFPYAYLIYHFVFYLAGAKAEVTTAPLPTTTPNDLWGYDPSATGRAKLFSSDNVSDLSDSASKTSVLSVHTITFDSNGHTVTVPTDGSNSATTPIPSATRSAGGAQATGSSRGRMIVVAALAGVMLQ